MIVQLTLQPVLPEYPIRRTYKILRDQLRRTPHYSLTARPYALDPPAYMPSNNIIGNILEFITITLQIFNCN